MDYFVLLVLIPTLIPAVIFIFLPLTPSRKWPLVLLAIPLLPLFYLGKILDKIGGDGAELLVVPFFFIPIAFIAVTLARFFSLRKTQEKSKLIGSVDFILYFILVVFMILALMSL